MCKHICFGYADYWENNKIKKARNVNLDLFLLNKYKNIQYNILTTKK